MKHLTLRSLLAGLVILTAWACNEDIYVEPTTFSTVRGQVLLSDTRQPVRRVLVRLSPTSRSVETDSLGRFRFDSVLAGKYTLQTVLTGYLNEFSAIDVSEIQTTSVTLLLRDDKNQNKPSTAPTAVSPKTGTDSLKTTLLLRWKSTDPERDSMTYDVAVYQDGITAPIVSTSGQRADSLQLRDLAYGKTFYWQVTVRDGIHAVKSDIFSFKTNAFPDFRYVYVRRINGRFQIITSNGTGTETQLTFDGSNWRPVVSPNRTEIAFISNRTTDLQLNVMNADGSNLRQVTTIPVAGIVANDLSFCWSPDGTQLLYPGNDKLYAIQTNNTGLRTVARANSGRFFSGCDWTAQGNQIVARTSGSDLYDNQLLLINPQDGSSREIQSSQGRISNPVFSVDGKQVLYSFDVDMFRNEQGRQLNARVFLYTIQSGATREVSGTSSGTVKPAGTNDLEPRFSPNGAKVVFTNVDNAGNSRPSVQTMDLDGQNRVTILTQAEMLYWR